MKHRLLLLRHGEVPSHRGDVAVTDRGLDSAERVGRRLATTAGRIRVLTGETLRTRQTGAAIATGARAAGATADEPRVAFALRNPDLYVAGERVNMVSSAAALAEQVPGMTEDEAAVVPFFAKFFSHPDRIGWWLRLGDVPGDDAEPWPAGSTTSPPASPTGLPSRPVSPSGSRIRPCCAPVH